MASINLTFEWCKWILKCYWKTENVENPPRSSYLTPLDIFLWGALKNAVYTSKQRTPQDLRRETETACAAVPLAIIKNVADVVNNAILPVVDILNTCDFKCENIPILSLFICELRTFKVCVFFFGGKYQVCANYRKYSRQLPFHSPTFIFQTSNLTAYVWMYRHLRANY
jgi:hypothetical protein